MIHYVLPVLWMTSLSHNLHYGYIMVCHLFLNGEGITAETTASIQPTNQPTTLSDKAQVLIMGCAPVAKSSVYDCLDCSRKPNSEQSVAIKVCDYNLYDDNMFGMLQWYIQATCATQGNGLYEGLDWLSQELSKR